MLLAERLGLGAHCQARAEARPRHLPHRPVGGCWVGARDVDLLVGGPIDQRRGEEPQGDVRDHGGPGQDREPRVVEVRDVDVPVRGVEHQGGGVYPHGDVGGEGGAEYLGDVPVAVVRHIDRAVGGVVAQRARGLELPGRARHACPRDLDHRARAARRDVDVPVRGVEGEGGREVSDRYCRDDGGARDHGHVVQRSPDSLDVGV